METVMKVDSTLIKKLREQKSWSQEHLAAAANLSVRTIQRVESDGNASVETRMAIAPALGVGPGALLPNTPTKTSYPRGAKYGIAFGFGGVTVGAVLACAGVASGTNSPAEAGTAYALIGLMSGLGCAFIGIFSNRYRQSESVDA